MPYLSRSWRVITYDGRGNGLSERPTDPDAFRSERIVDDLSAVLDDTGTDAAVLVGLCGDGVWHSILFAGTHPERVLGIVAFAVGVPLLSPPHPWRVRYSTTDELPTDEGWAKLNTHYWRRDYPGFVSFFFDQLLPEPHSTKQHEDTVAWALDGSLESMLGDMHAASDLTARSGGPGDAGPSAVRCCSSTAPRTAASRRLARNASPSSPERRS